jgi:hypothetical protein
MIELQPSHGKLSGYSFEHDANQWNPNPYSLSHRSRINFYSLPLSATEVAVSCPRATEGAGKPEPCGKERADL